MVFLRTGSAAVAAAADAVADLDCHRRHAEVGQVVVVVLKMTNCQFFQTAFIFFWFIHANLAIDNIAY